MHRRTRLAGYSLYELVMTLGLVSVVIGLALPSFGYLAGDSRLRAETNALFHAVHLARRKSVALRRVVTICPSVDGHYCDPANRWSAGWILFVNKSRATAGRRDENEAIIRRHSVADGVQIMSNRKSFSFRATQLRATNGTLTLCDAAGRAPTRALVVSYTGRPRVAREDRRGRPYRCAR